MSPPATVVRPAVSNHRLVANDRIDFGICCHRREIALYDRRIKYFRFNIARRVNIGRAIAIASVESRAVSGGGILRHADKIGLIVTHRPPAMSIIWRGEVLGRRSSGLNEQGRADKNKSPIPQDRA